MLHADLTPQVSLLNIHRMKLLTDLFGDLMGISSGKPGSTFCMRLLPRAVVTILH